MKKNYRQCISEIKNKYLHEEITYQDAKNEVEKLLIEMNAQGSIIAKQHGQKYKKLTFGYVFR